MISQLDELYPTKLFFEKQSFGFFGGGENIKSGKKHFSRPKQ